MRWNDADRQAFRDGQRLRAATVPNRLPDPPDPDEWTEQDEP